ncbi:hypothetical protein ACQCSX_11255 [Pseudarthrobacter sp. P1]|uniref:hypothetical protein n=1 Tax=Pseudarthrobacter sp. P1 TaxID=3418418 RepID=UPI003CF17784
MMMKRRDLMKKHEQIAKAEGEDMVIREGGNHAVVTIGENTAPVPRHNEISEILAKKIIKLAEGK